MTSPTRSAWRRLRSSCQALIEAYYQEVGRGKVAAALAGMAVATVQGATAVGDRAGVRTRRCGEALDHAGASPLPRCHASQDGFDLEAGVRVRADQRDRLERLCRYALRPGRPPPLIDEGAAS